MTGRESALYIDSRSAQFFSNMPSTHGQCEKDYLRHTISHRGKGGGGNRTHLSASFFKNPLSVSSQTCRRTRDHSATPPRTSGSAFRTGPFCAFSSPQASKASMTIADTNTIEIVFRTLMSELIAGPAVSLNGSPTVSPMTAAV